MKRKFTLFISALFLSAFSFSQVTLKLGSIENAEPGTFINVPLIVTGLSSAGQSFIGIEITFNFQENIIIYDTLASGHPLTPVSQWFAGSIPGKVSANWIDPNLNPINVDDNSTLVQFVFFYSGGQTDLLLDQAATLIYDQNTNVIPVSQFINGSITQAQGSESSIWNGTASWATASNWSNGIPGDSTNAVINSGVIDLSSGGVCRNLQINPGAKLVIQPGNSLTINGDFNNDGELLIKTDSLIQGSLIVYGSVTQTGVSEMELNLYNGISYLFSAPVEDATTDIFTGAGPVSTYQENNNSWLELSSGAVFEPATGYRIESTGNSTRIFNGNFHSTTLSVNLPFTSQGNAANEGWNLTGNPFTNSFDADDYLATVNTDRAIYVWDGYKYRVWNGTAGSIPNGIIPPMTGFFVKANSAGAQATFTKEGMIHDFSHYAGSYSLPSNVLQVSISNFDDDTYGDDAYLQIETVSTHNYDGPFDAFKLANHPDYPEIFIHSADNNRLAISTIPEATEVKCGFKAPVDGTYEISALTSGFLPERPVYLIDLELEITKDLRTENYIFITTAGDHPERFKIVLTGLGTDDLPGEKEMMVYSSRGKIIVNSLMQYGRSGIKVYDLSGRLVSQSQVSLEAGSSVSIPGIPGINIISVETTAGIFRFKVFIR